MKEIGDCILTSSPNNCKLPYIIIEICMLNTNSSMLPQFTTVKYLVGHSFEHVISSKHHDFMGSHCAGDHCWSNNLLLVTKPTMYILPLEAHGQWTPDISENMCCHTLQAPTFLNCREPKGDREQITMPLAIIMDNKLTEKLKEVSA